LALLVPVAWLVPPLVDAVWSPVEALVALLSAWSPVVVVLLLLSDWSPVVVALSIVTLERPRRSICGLNDDVEPVTVLLLSDVEPVMDDVLLAEEPVTEGLVAPLVEPVVPARALFVPEVAELVVEAWLSGMQSWCTGLAECSLARPVSLSASLPACG
jgi:hypothetical protein